MAVAVTAIGAEAEAEAGAGAVAEEGAKIAELLSDIHSYLLYYGR